MSRQINLMKQYLTILAIASLPLLPLSAQTKLEKEIDNGVFIPISKYMESGSVDGLAAWFANKMEIDLFGNISRCSRNQARQIIRNFFAEYVPRNFEIVYKSGTYPMEYAVGTLDSGGNKFRVTILVKIQESGNYIELLKFEKE